MWRYSQLTGILTSQAGNNIAAGYSGNGTGKNNPALQSVPNVGPLPRGFYNIQAPVDTADHGPYVLRLDPFKTNLMYGRAGFLIHGDKKNFPPGWASHGCMIFSRPVRELVWESEDHQLEVV